MAKGETALHREARERAEAEAAARRAEREPDMELTNSADLEALLIENGADQDDAKVHVYQLDANTADEWKIWSGTPAEYDLDSLAKKFGSGKYRTMVYAKTEAGNYARALNRVRAFRLSPDEERALHAAKNPAPQGMQLTPESLAAAIRAAMPAPVAVPANNLGMLKEVAEIVRTLAPQAAPVAHVAQPDPLAMIRTIAEFMRGNERDAGAEPIDKGVRAGGYDLLLRVVDQFGPLFKKAMEQGQPPLYPASYTPPLVSAADGGNVVPLHASQPAPVSANGLTPEQEQEIMRLKMGLSFLVMQAEAENDPATYADVIIDNVPEEELRKMLNAPDWLEQLARFEPNVKKFGEWFGKLKEEVIEELDAPEGDQPPG